MGLPELMLTVYRSLAKHLMHVNSSKRTFQDAVLGLLTTTFCEWTLLVRWLFGGMRTLAEGRTYC